MSIKALTIATVGFVSTIAVAQTEEKATVDVGGNLDFYYQNSPQASETAAGSGVRALKGRVFDARHGQWALNLAEVNVAAKKGQATLKVDLAAGDMIEGLTPGFDKNADGQLDVIQDPTKHVNQAYLSFAPKGTPGLTVNFGKFYTPIGFEVTRAKDNWQYSRSLGFNYAIPFWHEGLSVGYAWIPDRFTSTIYIVNGWDGRLGADANQLATTILSLGFTPAQGLTINYNGLSGAESNTDSVRQVHEINASYGLTDSVTVAADGIFGSQTNAVGDASAKWSSLAAYVRWAATSTYALSGRYESFDDSDQGFAIAGGLATAGAKQKISSTTLTNAFDLGDGLEARFELRQDQSDDDAYFVDKDGAATKSQSSVAFAFLYRL